MKAIDTLLNTSDLGTKYLDASRRSALLAMLPLIAIRHKGLGQAVAVASLFLLAAGETEKEAPRRDVALQIVDLAPLRSNAQWRGDVGMAMAVTWSTLCGMALCYYMGKQSAVQTHVVSTEPLLRSRRSQDSDQAVVDSEDMMRVMNRLTASQLQQLFHQVGYMQDSSKITKQLMVEILAQAGPRIKVAFMARAKGGRARIAALQDSSEGSATAEPDVT